MKNYIPDARFDPDDPPAGDRRWWYKNLYELRSELGWQGLEPDQFSPHNLAEENEIKLAILEGVLEPRNDYEAFHRRLIAFTRPKGDWPTKWVVCKRCGCEWNCTGDPAGKQNKFTDQINCHQLVDKSGYVWLWPNLCQLCADRREARPEKPPKTERKIKSPIVD